MSIPAYEHVKTAFAENDLDRLKDIYTDLMKRLDASPNTSVEELLNAIHSTSFSLSRNFGAESFIPKVVREEKKSCITAIR